MKSWNNPMQNIYIYMYVLLSDGEEEEDLSDLKDAWGEN